MRLIYEDKAEKTLTVDNTTYQIDVKPNLSFTYSYITIPDTEIMNEPEAEIVVDEDGNMISSEEEYRAVPNQFCKDTSETSYNQAMTPKQEIEVLAWITSFLANKALEEKARLEYEASDEYLNDVLKPKYKQKLKESVNQRPMVNLTISSGEISIDGGRTDKDNFYEEYKRMERKGVTQGFIKDYNNTLVPCTIGDMLSCYEAIIDNYYVVVTEKWQKEIEIDNATSIEELEEIVKSNEQDAL